ncbi:MAG: hypothetical protein OXF02_03510 [Simkaniaceae bacterium]|nr:hypothetical protein [Simkaniaceae bacterium]
MSVKVFRTLFFVVTLSLSYPSPSTCAEDISAKGVVPPEAPPPDASFVPVNRRLFEAQAKFETAKRMFNPYYAGPLLAPSAHNIPPGHFNVQPYLFLTDTYGRFDSKGKRRSLPHNVFSVQGLVALQLGLTDWLDFTAVVNATENLRNKQSAGNIADTQVECGLQIAREEPYRPAVRVTVSELLPTGKYEKLNPSKADLQSSGSGAYTTVLSFNLTKAVWWLSTHPFSLRGIFSYAIPSHPHVEGFNTYGGGFGTEGKVRPGKAISADTSIEFSFAQKWVFALDLVYTYRNRSSFRGRRGVTAEGDPASTGGPSSGLFSIAPALEYNPTPALGFVAGGWFGLAGRNSATFASALFTFTYFW